MIQFFCVNYIRKFQLLCAIGNAMFKKYCCYLPMWSAKVDLTRTMKNLYAKYNGRHDARNPFFASS